MDHDRSSNIDTSDTRKCTVVANTKESGYYLIFRRGRIEFVQTICLVYIDNLSRGRKATKKCVEQAGEEVLL